MNACVRKQSDREPAQVSLVRHERHEETQKYFSVNAVLHSCDSYYFVVEQTDRRANEGMVGRSGIELLDQTICGLWRSSAARAPPANVDTDGMADAEPYELTYVHMDTFLANL